VGHGDRVSISAEAKLEVAAALAVVVSAFNQFQGMKAARLDQQNPVFTALNPARNPRPRLLVIDQMRSHFFLISGFP
jgi:hypothetical protein